MDEYTITSVQHDWLCIHTPIPELCNAIQITGQMPFRFYIIHLHVNISISFNVTLVFHCLLPALCDDGCSGVLNRVYAQRLYVLPSSQNLTTREQCHAQLKNEIMNGNQGDHVTSCEQGVEANKDWIFVAHFINIFKTTMPMPCTDVSYTPKSRCHTSGTGGLVWAVKLWILDHSPTMHSKCDACILVRKICNASKAPALWKSSQAWVNSAPSRRTTQIVCFLNLKKYFDKYMNLE